MLGKLKSLRKTDNYQPIAGVLGMGEDYHVYESSVTEKLTAAGMGILLGVALGYVFFNSWIMAAILSGIAAIALQEPYRLHQQKKRLRNLLLQFKDLLETLSASYSAGENTTKAFGSAQEEMTQLYGEDSDIVAELTMINTGLQHNYTYFDYRSCICLGILILNLHINNFS